MSWTDFWKTRPAFGLDNAQEIENSEKWMSVPVVRPGKLILREYFGMSFPGFYKKG